jgi:hypothetical protein
MLFSADLMKTEIVAPVLGTLRTGVDCSRHRRFESPSFSETVYNAISAGTPKYVFNNVAHRGYFKEPEFWRELAEFFGLNYRA